HALRVEHRLDGVDPGFAASSQHRLLIVDLRQPPILEPADGAAGGVKPLPQVLRHAAPGLRQLPREIVAPALAAELAHDVVEPGAHLTAAPAELASDGAAPELVQDLLELALRLAEDGETLVLEVLEFGLAVVFDQPNGGLAHVRLAAAVAVSQQI